MGRPEERSWCCLIYSIPEHFKQDADVRHPSRLLALGCRPVSRSTAISYPCTVGSAYLPAAAWTVPCTSSPRLWTSSVWTSSPRLRTSSTVRSATNRLRRATDRLRSAPTARRLRTQAGRIRIQPHADYAVNESAQWEEWKRHDVQSRYDDGHDAGQDGSDADDAHEPDGKR